MMTSLLNLSHWMHLLLAMPITIGGVDAFKEQIQTHEQHRRPVSISIIMPVYERPALLALALEQIRQTNYEGRVEIVVMDDSKTTTYENLISSHFSSSNEEERMTLVYRHLDWRVTVGEKRNMACASSSGEIVIMMDDDDIYHPDRIAYQIEPIINGMADMTVLRQGIWLQLYGDGRQSKFFQATPRMERSVHYGTLAFRREVWNIDNGMVYTDASLLDEVDFYNKVKASSQMHVLEMPNNGMHVYVRHPNNINRPGTDLARDPRFIGTSIPSNVPFQHLAKLEKVIVSMHSTERILQSSPKCGACIDVNSEIGGDSRCVSADDCWGSRESIFQDWNVWNRCMNENSSCTGCEKSSDDICEDRCVLIGLGPCKTMQGSYDMYANYPAVDCERFSTCDCNLLEPPTDPPTEDETKIKCGSCVDVNGPCVSADECWDMYSGYPNEVWDRCMGSSSGITGIPCSGCAKSSDGVCDDRCVRIGFDSCKSLSDCFDMYKDYPDINCNRFPTCDCISVKPPTDSLTEDETKIKCGFCVDVNGPCVSADECWDMYSGYPNEVWNRCMGSSTGITGSPCSGCAKSSDAICEDRCVRIGFDSCKSLSDCFDMYKDYPDINCNRFPTCACISVKPPTEPPTESHHDNNGKFNCGACINKYGPCITADECWDMYSDYPDLVWKECMDVSGDTSSPCSGCEKSTFCEERCVSTNGPCKTLSDCYDMYASSPDIDCDRFPSCDCSFLDFDMGLATIRPDLTISTTTVSNTVNPGITTTEVTIASITTQATAGTSDSVAADSDMPQILTPGYSQEALNSSVSTNETSTTTTSETTTTKATPSYANTTQATDTSSEPTQPTSTNNINSPSNQPTEFPTTSDFDVSRGWITLTCSNYVKVVALVVGFGIPPFLSI